MESAILNSVLIWGQLIWGQVNLGSVTISTPFLSYLPDFERIPIALVFSIHCLAVNVKLFSPACFLNTSNSMGLKFRLYICSTDLIIQ
jgi:hypothetical protein